jgi:hypothetical protein
MGADIFQKELQLPAELAAQLALPDFQVHFVRLAEPG